MKLSIITVNYNNRDGLQRTIDSVVSQTWSDFEWIIIDGGSTDGSKELIEKYQSHFAYWCSEPDKGIYNAMNKGIDKAKGEWINFMNSGDCFVNPRVLSGVFEKRSYSNEVGVLLGDTVMSYPFGYYLMTSVNKWGDTDFCHQSSFVRTEAMKKSRFDESLKYIADRDAIDKVLSNGYTLFHLNQAIAIYDAFSGLTSNKIAVLVESKKKDGVANGWRYYKWLFKQIVKDRFWRMMPKEMLLNAEERKAASIYRPIQIAEYL